MNQDTVKEEAMVKGCMQSQLLPDGVTLANNLSQHQVPRGTMPSSEPCAEVYVDQLDPQAGTQPALKEITPFKQMQISRHTCQ